MRHVVVSALVQDIYFWQVSWHLSWFLDAVQIGMPWGWDTFHMSVSSFDWTYSWWWEGIWCFELGLLYERCMYTVVGDELCVDAACQDLVTWLVIVAMVSGIDVWHRLTLWRPSTTELGVQQGRRRSQWAWQCGHDRLTNTTPDVAARHCALYLKVKRLRIENEVQTAQLRISLYKNGPATD